MSEKPPVKSGAGASGEVITHYNCKKSSDKTNDGGSVFPHKVYGSLGGCYEASGMSLRDWMAGMALQGILAAHANPIGIYPCHSSDSIKTCAVDSYKLADAMIKARGE